MSKKILNNIKVCLTVIVLFGGLFFTNIEASKYSNYIIKEIRFEFDNLKDGKYRDSLQKLIYLKTGEPFSLKNVRKSIETIYKVGRFSDVEVRTETDSKKSIIVYFKCFGKSMIRSIKFSGIGAIYRKELSRTFRSVRTGYWYNKNDFKPAINEIRIFLESKGYFNSEISFDTITRKFITSVIFKIRKNSRTYINRAYVRVKQNVKIPISFETGYQDKRYIPEDVSDDLEQVREFLKNKNYYFPSVSAKRVFLNKRKERVNLYINIEPGFKYIFNFIGIKNLSSLIAPIWSRKVFDKWAERESRLKINSYLKNKGYLNPEIKSEIKYEGDRKVITFDVKRNQRFSLGKIYFSGNKKFSSRILKNVITVDDILFDRIFYLRNNSIRIDIEVLKWFYYFKGFPLVKVSVKPEFKKKIVDLNYIIDEGKFFVIDSLEIEGNRFINDESLKKILRSSAGGPFVQRNLDEDVVRIRNLYFSYGFDDINITLQLSKGYKKKIVIKISEGKRFRFGSLIIIGGSASQSSFVRRNFSLKNGMDFNRLLFEKNKNRIEKNSVFSEVKYIKLKNGNIIDLMIIMTPNKSKYLGFGIGYEERTNARLTFEYQKKNIFHSYSTLSALIQFGLKERRGIIVLDTPSVFRGGIDSSLKIWEENEIYRSYKFNRYGVSESFVKKISPYSYILASLSWYRTKLLELDIAESGIDRINTPFNTTSLNLSYVIDSRDDPFLPAKGEFFSTDIKFAFPLFEKDYSFFRFRWGYQKNIRFLKRGIFSFSLRNGFASGNLSITERFFGGGINTFRGISNDNLGPLDSVTGEPGGGNAMLLINLESTFPFYLIPIENFYYSVFLDIGNIYKGVNEFALKNIERALGIGIRIKTAIGLLKFDIAYNFRKRENVNPIVFHIGIGNVL